MRRLRASEEASELCAEAAEEIETLLAVLERLGEHIREYYSTEVTGRVAESGETG